jgi:hypothetical protein
VMLEVCEACQLGKEARWGTPKSRGEPTWGFTKV